MPKTTLDKTGEAEQGAGGGISPPKIVQYVLLAKI